MSSTVSYVVGALVFLLVIFIFTGLPMIFEYLEKRRQQQMAHQLQIEQIRSDAAVRSLAEDAKQRQEWQARQDTIRQQRRDAGPIPGSEWGENQAPPVIPESST
jgi:uncharacterized membrane protein YhiD involved in acid resistance